MRQKAMEADALCKEAEAKVGIGAPGLLRRCPGVNALKTETNIKRFKQVERVEAKRSRRGFGCDGFPYGRHIRDVKPHGIVF